MEIVIFDAKSLAVFRELSAQFVGLSFDDISPLPP